MRRSRPLALAAVALAASLLLVPAAEGGQTFEQADRALETVGLCTRADCWAGYAGCMADPAEGSDDLVGEFAIELGRFQMGTEHQVDALARLHELAPEPGPPPRRQRRFHPSRARLRPGVRVCVLCRWP